MTRPRILDKIETKLLSPEGPIDRPAALRPAAVALILFPHQGDEELQVEETAGEVRVLLTLRTEGLSRHPGQVSLPGGVMEKEDASLWDTALRETGEELGMKTGRLKCLGRLEPVPMTRSQYFIVPFVAWSPRRPKIDPDGLEVQEVFQVSLSQLLRADSIGEEVREFRGDLYRVTCYRIGTHVVWGVTARILADFASRLGVEVPWSKEAPGTVAPL